MFSYLANYSGRKGGVFSLPSFISSIIMKDFVVILYKSFHQACFYSMSNIFCLLYMLYENSAIDMSIKIFKDIDFDFDMDRTMK